MKRSNRTIASLVAAISTALLLGVAPTSAFGSVEEPAGLEASAGMRPDGWVRYAAFRTPWKTYRDPSPWVGDNVYNKTGRNQTVRELAVGAYESTDYYIFQVAIQNDGPADRFAIRADGEGSWRVKYFRGSTNITSAVVNGTYQTPDISPGATFTIKVRIFVGDIGTGVVRRITATSLADPAQADTVRIRIDRSECTC